MTPPRHTRCHGYRQRVIGHGSTDWLARARPTIEQCKTRDTNPVLAANARMSSSSPRRPRPAGSRLVAANTWQDVPLHRAVSEASPMPVAQPWERRCAACAGRGQVVSGAWAAWYREYERLERLPDRPARLGALVEHIRRAPADADILACPACGGMGAIVTDGGAALLAFLRRRLSTGVGGHPPADPPPPPVPDQLSHRIGGPLRVERDLGHPALAAATGIRGDIRAPKHARPTPSPT